jgi:hypothetical protein
MSPAPQSKEQAPNRRRMARGHNELRPDVYPVEIAA